MEFPIRRLRAAHPSRLVHHISVRVMRLGSRPALLTQRVLCTFWASQAGRALNIQCLALHTVLSHMHCLTTFLESGLWPCPNAITPGLRNNWLTPCAGGRSSLPHLFCTWRCWGLHGGSPLARDGHAGCRLPPRRHCRRLLLLLRLPLRGCYCSNCP